VVDSGEERERDIAVHGIARFFGEFFFWKRSSNQFDDMAWPQR
jgi:nitrogen fixation-related uncharacterized protein